MTETKNNSNMFRVFAIGLTIALGGFIFGYDTGAISAMVNMPKYIEAIGEYDPALGSYAIPSWRSGLIVGGVSIGGLIGSFVFGRLAEKKGRKNGLAIANILVVAAVVFQAVGYKSWEAVFVGRLFGGMAIGGLSAVCPMYIGETAPTSKRALLVSSFQFLITFGILVGQGIGFGCSFWENSIGQFLFPLLFIAAFAAPVTIAAVFFLPESARYLVSQNRISEARQSLSTVMNLPAGSQTIIDEVENIRSSIPVYTAENHVGWWGLLSSTERIRYRVLLGISIMMLQQLSGINYFFYYGTSLFKEISNFNPYATSMILGAVNLVGTVILIPIVANMRRRVVLMVGSIVMFVAFIIFSTLGSFVLYQPDGTVNNTVGAAMIILACLFIIGFAGTWAPISFVVISEMFPQKIRSKATSLAVACNWLVNAGITFLTPIATKAIGYKFGYVFSFFTFISIFVVYFFVFETRGRDFEEIEMMFTSGISARQSTSVPCAPIDKTTDAKV